MVGVVKGKQLAERIAFANSFRGRVRGIKDGKPLELTPDEVDLLYDMVGDLHTRYSFEDRCHGFMLEQVSNEFREDPREQFGACMLAFMLYGMVDLFRYHGYDLDHILGEVRKHYESGEEVKSTHQDWQDMSAVLLIHLFAYASCANMGLFDLAENYMFDEICSMRGIPIPEHRTKQ